jgi:hypothetical protein
MNSKRLLITRNALTLRSLRAADIRFVFMSIY